MSVLLHEVIHRGRQSLNGQRIVSFAGQKLKAAVDRDAYDFQSSADVSVLTEVGWKVLTYVPIEECEIVTFTYGTRDEDAWRRAIGLDLDRLIAIGMGVIS